MGRDDIIRILRMELTSGDVGTRKTLAELFGSEFGETVVVAREQDISGGVEASLKNYRRWTLYLKTGGAVDITIELSPDGGETWFTIPESPVSFSAAGDDVIEMGYDATNIRLTGSNSTSVTALIRGIF